jgi:hypothetical protein
VVIHYPHPEAQVELVLGDQWRIQLKPELIGQLQTLLGGPEKVKIIY